jgi:hypothetical protein
MTELTKSDFHFSLGAKKILLYYFGYSILFLIFHLSTISMVSFFHFLLDHDMLVIENWLYRNAWEMIFISKIFAAFVVIKALQLNNYFIKNLFFILKNDIWKPSRSVIIFIIFLAVLFYALIFQFGGEIVGGNKSVDFVYISFFGSIFFYFIDFIVINVLVRNISLKSKRKSFLLMLALIIIFMLFTKATLPYISKYYIFLVLHFFTLLLFLFTNSRNIINPILYSLVIIGPLSAFYGLDLVWDNAHALYSYKESLPVVGIIGVWFIGLIYYYKFYKRS